MWHRKRRFDEGPSPGAGQAAVAPSTEKLLATIERLTLANRERPDRETERRLLQLRHQVGIRLLDADGSEPEHPSPDFDGLPERGGLVGLAPEDLTPQLLRAGILRDGCVLVRGLADRGEAIEFAEEIDRCFAERDRLAAGGAPADGYYEEFTPDPRFDVAVRPWVQVGGGVLAADAPRPAFQMLEMFEASGVSELARDYLGEPALISVHKTTLRKADPAVGGAWHQDGAFMGPVRSLNLWLPLSRCGDEAPGLDIVPRRLDDIVATGTAGTVLGFEVSQETAERAAGDRSIVRPIFEPGDALFFDELFLHRTGSDPAMPRPRYAVENWFFGGSGFPGEYAPIAV